MRGKSSLCRQGLALNTFEQWQRSQSCYGQRLSWVQNARIPEGDRAVFEDKVLSKVLDAAVKIDGLNFCNSLAFEMIVRRKQLLCEAHVGNPGQPSYEASDYFMGVIQAGRRNSYPQPHRARRGRPDVLAGGGVQRGSLSCGGAFLRAVVIW